MKNTPFHTGLLIQMAGKVLAVDLEDQDSTQCATTFTGLICCNLILNGAKNRGKTSTVTWLEGFLGARGEETWDDPVMHRANYQSKCQGKFKSPNMSHVLKDISQRQSRSCVYSHCVSPITPANICWFSGLQITKSTNQTPNKLSMYLSVFHPQDCIFSSCNDKCVYNTVGYVHPLLKLESMLHSCM